MTLIEGRLLRGLGQAAGFTQIEWVRRQLVDLAGIDPHPGTVNLALGDEVNRTRWRRWRGLPGHAMEPADAAFCGARCYPVRIEGRVPAAVLLPEIAGYPEDKLEIVAALPLRRHLSMDEGALVRVELCRPLVAKAVLFDIDGTLVDSVGAYLEVARIAAQALGLEVTETQVRHSLATGSNFWKGVVPADRHDAGAVMKALSAHAGREWPRVLREHGKVFEGLAQTLDAMKRLGIKLGIVSGARPEVLDLLRQDGILDRFDSIVLGADVSRRKPDPEGILKCLKVLDMTPAAAVYIGDTPVDIQASRAAGVCAVGVLTGAGDSATLSMHWPDRLISSHARLAEIIAPE
ncbi:MAG: HAD-IA family hydrolase [Betaproteobacteria bacterium]|nr:HAD-IA family hydrolase [Betaproteobacteria bacterium]